MKYLTLLTIPLLLLAFSFFPDDGVVVKHNYPASAKAGEEITTEITITKSVGIQFGKLQIDVPSGITLSVADTKGGQFTQGENNGKIIWMQFPSENEVKIQVKLVISPDASGTKTINTKFQYVSGNEKKSVDIPSHDISIEAVSIQQASISNKETDTTQNFSTPEQTNSRVSVERTLTKDEKTGIISVYIKINKETIKGFAKYTDVIPEGLVATKGKATANGAFKFSENKASIVWATLPKEEIIEASYYIKATRSFDENPILKGSFAYLEDETTKKEEAKDIILQLISSEKQSQIVVDTVTKDAREETQATLATSTSVDKQKETEIIENTKEVAAEKDKQEEITVDLNKQDKPINSNSNNIKFHVQIGAYKNSPEISYFEKKYKLGEEIFTDLHNGLNKYMVGKSEEYKIARDHRERVRNKGVNDAFITAYSSGKRITVQEALMTLNQKWLK